MAPARRRRSRASPPRVGAQPGTMDRCGTAPSRLASAACIETETVDADRAAAACRDPHGHDVRSSDRLNPLRSPIPTRSRLLPTMLSKRRAAQYIRRVAGEWDHAPSQADELRRLVAIIALAVAVITPLVDPSSAPDLVFAAIPVVAFGLWAFVPGVPLWALSLAVIIPVVIAQRFGELEPLMFEVSLLAFAVARWSESLTAAAALGLLAATTPVVVGVVQDPSEAASVIWVVGIIFPWVLGRAFVRQGRLAGELEAARHELAQQALLAERRGIARDVHDFVGHGLAAVMLQVTSARHVLRRDPASAEEALRSAEEVGRRSMEELRRTVTQLRSDDEAGVAPPVPSAREIPALVDQARAGGLAVELRLRGDLTRIPTGVGVALYRIAQEALANAARHAPRAQTVLGLELSNRQVRLVAETSGPAAAVPAADPERPRYGLIGMRERAAALGGDFAAGPTPAGWRVSCRLPLELNDERPVRGVRGP
jgi:signal transduction histidine kinase